jgi:hypothetical protein
MALVLLYLLLLLQLQQGLLHGATGAVAMRLLTACMLTHAESSSPAPDQRLPDHTRHPIAQRCLRPC